MSVIIIFSSLVDKVMLLSILKVVISAVDVTV
jgi:hypothetical protein